MGNVRYPLLSALFHQGGAQENRERVINTESKRERQRDIGEEKETVEGGRGKKGERAQLKKRQEDRFTDTQTDGEKGRDTERQTHADGERGGGRKRQRQTVRETLAQENAERHRSCLKNKLKKKINNLHCLHLELFPD